MHATFFFFLFVVIQLDIWHTRESWTVSHMHLKPNVPQLRAPVNRIYRSFLQHKGKIIRRDESIKVVCVFIYLLYKYGWNYVWKKKFEMHFSISRLRFLHFYHLVNVSFFINMQICRIQIRVACAAIHRCRFTFQFTVTRSFMRRINEG